MAIQPIKFLVSPSATATNGSKTITVTGNVDCSHVYSGTAIALGTRQVVEAVSGTKPDGSGNSIITLRDDWTDPTTTAKLVAFNTIEGLAEAIRRAREVVQASEAALSGNVSYMGDHSAATGNYPAAPGEGLGSQIYRISIAGTISEREYKVGELIYYDQYFSQWRSFFDGFGTAAQRNAGTGTADLPDNAQLNLRLGTTGNLGNAAQKTVTESPTDTTLARILKVGDFCFGHIANLYTGNLNDAPFGWNLVSSSSPNNFFGTEALLFTFASSPLSTRKNQTLILTATNVKANRSFNGGVWSQWALEYTSSNILGTVGQSAGIPTGAIIERGVNVNGNYQKFADGTLICMRSYNESNAVNIAEGNLFRSASLSFTFPSVFVSTDVLVLGSFPNTGAWLSQRNSSATNAAFVWQSAVALTSNTMAHLLAIGRWY
jgi:hypothetical protein